MDSKPNRIGVTTHSDGSATWNIWAPAARRVELVLLQNEARAIHPLAPTRAGYHELTLPGISEGTRYAVQLDNGPDRPDPASFWQPDGVHLPSAVLKMEEFTWTDQNWEGLHGSDLVIYEIHVGTFTPEGTFESIIPRLEPLRELGITAIELMPIAQFPGQRNWGYDGVHPFAAQDSYGGPHSLQKLIDACHAHGLAIILDVVYNHLGPEGNYLGEFGPYFTDHYRTPWGSAVNFDGPGSDGVRDYFLENVRYWLEDFHFDGLRLDAIHAIYDFSAKHILRDIKETAQAVDNRTGRRTDIIAESSLNDVTILEPFEIGGYGLDSQWNDDFHHAVHALLTGERQGYYTDFGTPSDFKKLFEQSFIYDGQHSRYRNRRHGGPPRGRPGNQFVVFIQNHDQIGNRAMGDRLTTIVSPAAQRWAVSLMLLSPHIPLLFMGEEYGEIQPFPFFCSFLDDGLVEAVRNGRKSEFESFRWKGEIPDPQSEETFQSARIRWGKLDHRGESQRRLLYKDLLAARREWNIMQDSYPLSVKLWPNEETPDILEWAISNLTIWANLRDLPIQPPAKIDNNASLLFSSEWARYGGGRKEGQELEQLLAYECIACGNPRPENNT